VALRRISVRIAREVRNYWKKISKISDFKRKAESDKRQNKVI
jgi:hypothetical protein